MTILTAYPPSSYGQFSLVKQVKKTIVVVREKRRLRVVSFAKEKKGNRRCRWHLKQQTRTRGKKGVWWFLSWSCCISSVIVRARRVKVLTEILLRFVLYESELVGKVAESGSPTKRDSQRRTKGGKLTAKLTRAPLWRRRKRGWRQCRRPFERRFLRSLADAWNTGPPSTPKILSPKLLRCSLRLRNYIKYKNKRWLWTNHVN